MIVREHEKPNETNTIIFQLRRSINSLNVE